MSKVEDARVARSMLRGCSRYVLVVEVSGTSGSQPWDCPVKVSSSKGTPYLARKC